MIFWCLMNVINCVMRSSKWSLAGWSNKEGFNIKESQVALRNRIVLFLRKELFLKMMNSCLKTWEEQTPLRKSYLSLIRKFRLQRDWSSIFRSMTIRWKFIYLMDSLRRSWVENRTAGVTRQFNRLINYKSIH